MRSIPLELTILAVDALEDADQVAAGPERLLEGIGGAARPREMARLRKMMYQDARDAASRISITICTSTLASVTRCTRERSVFTSELREERW